MKINNSIKLNNKTNNFFSIGLFIFLSLFIIILVKPIKVNKNLTFKVSDDITSYATKNDCLIGLKKDGTLIEYNKDGKEIKTNQTDIVYLAEQEDLFYIKNDGSIIIGLNDEYNGETIGCIPGAISGCVSNDIIAIVTENGELFVQSDQELSFKFKDMESVDEWTKVKDVNDVIKVIVVRDFGNDVLLVLNKKGEVYSCSSEVFLNGPLLEKISDNMKITDIGSHWFSFLLLDELGDVYEIGHSMFNRDNTYIRDLTQISRLSNIVKISTRGDQGAALTLEGNIYLWDNREFTKGKASYFNPYFEKILEGKWDDIKLGNYLYAFKDGLVIRIAYKDYIINR